MTQDRKSVFGNVLKEFLLGIGIEVCYDRYVNGHADPTDLGCQIDLGSPQV